MISRSNWFWGYPWPGLHYIRRKSKSRKIRVLPLTLPKSRFSHSLTFLSRQRYCQQQCYCQQSCWRLQTSFTSLHCCIRGECTVANPFCRVYGAFSLLHQGRVGRAISAVCLSFCLSDWEQDYWKNNPLISLNPTIMIWPGLPIARND